MAFLRRLLSFFASFIPTKSSQNSPREVRSDEPIVRYIIDSKHFHKPTHVVKPDAFLPNGDPPTTSVFRVDGLSSDDVWGIGHRIANKRSRTLKARADFDTRALMGTPLKLDADDDPPRHANIIGWPLEKSDRLQLALEIAEKSSLLVVP